VSTLVSRVTNQPLQGVFGGYRPKAVSQGITCPLRFDRQGLVEPSRAW